MKSALIIGLGGTGCKVIKRLEDVVLWRDSKLLSEHSEIKYLALDTHRGQLSDVGLGDGTNSFHLGVNAGQVRSVSALPEENRKWLSSDVITEITDGAGAVRMQGKYAFFVNYANIKSRIGNALQLLQRKLTNATTNELRIFVVANSVSGTGSGAFVDMGYLVRKIINEDPSLQKLNIKLMLVLTMPVNLLNLDHLSNAYYALSELDYYMSGNEYFIDDITKSGDTITHKPTSADNRKPFDFVYLTGSRNFGANSTDAQVDQLISEYIYSELFSTAGTKASAPRDDFRKYLRERDVFGLSTCYSAFGLAIIEYPVSQITKLSSILYTKAAIEEWGKENTDPPQFEMSNIFLGGSNASDFNAQLQKEINIRRSDDSVINKNLVTLLTNTKELHYENFLADYDIGELKLLVNRLNEGFSDRSNIDITDSTQITQGIVGEVVRRNAEKLFSHWFEGKASSTEPGSFDGIKVAVLKYMYGNKGGVGLAKMTLDRIVNQLNTLQGRSQTQLTTRVELEVDDILERIETVKSDLLLRPFRATLIKKHLNEFKERIDEYTIKKLEAVVFSHSSHLISGTLSSVNDMRAKLNDFEIKVSELVNELDRTAITLTSPQPLNGYVVKGNHISANAKHVANGVAIAKSHLNFVKDDLQKICEKEWNKAGEGFAYLKIDDVIGRVRDLCVAKLASRGVIEELREDLEEKQGETNELQNILADINDVYSKLSMELDPKDPISAAFRASSTDSNFMRCFYNGANSVTSSDDAERSDNWLTKQLFVKGIIDHNGWGKANQGLENNNIVVFLRERGGYPLHFWNDLSATKWQEALDAIKKTPDSSSTPRYLGRQDVDFPGFMPSDNRRVANSKETFWLSIISGAIQPMRNGFDIVGTNKATIKKAGISLPKGYNNAIRKLAANRDLYKKATEAYILKIENLGIQQFLARVYGVLTGEFPETVVGIDNDIKNERHNLIIRWIQRNEAYRTEWNSIYPDDAVGDDIADFIIKASEPDDDNKLPSVGCYCAICKQYLGPIDLSDEDLKDILEGEDGHICTSPSDDN